jgi:hypothetical protein
MIRIAAAALVLLVGAVPASAQPATREVVVLTSFPKELFEAYKQAFEQKTPGVTRGSSGSSRPRSAGCRWCPASTRARPRAIPTRSR